MDTAIRHPTSKRCDGMLQIQWGELPDGVRRLNEWDAYPVRPSEALEDLVLRADDVRAN